MGVFSVRWWLGLSIVAMVGCAAEAPEPTTSTTEPQAVVGGNGNWSNGLTTNGLIDNGIWSNGNWSNGNWSNGNWSNGNWSNGNWSNGNWSNGNWSNGNWSNGIWSNGNWSNGNWSNGNWSNGIWSNGAWTQNLDALALLRSNPSTGQLLQYMYSCAMPAGVTKTLDPAGANVVLTGAIGLAPAWDTEGGECDQSCQRWISACVLARTNAYGATVEISMRAPASAPLHIRNALATTVNERTNWNKREGAFYGNLFNMTPQCDGVASTGPDCAGITTFANAPKLYACAGPISNVPAVTKRFCSSQGDTGPITVVGDCLAPITNVPTACSGMDDLAEGAMTSCFDKLSGPRTTYPEVITVYLKDPVNVCGNSVCEPGEENGVCATDCRPGAWAKTLPFRLGVQGGLYFPFQGTSKLANDMVYVGGEVDGDITLGGETFPDADGSAFIARYTIDGVYIPGSGHRFLPANLSLSNAVLDVASDGAAVIAGFQNDHALAVLAKVNLDGTVAWTRNIGDSGQTAAGKMVVDSAGDIIVVASGYGPQHFPTSAMTEIVLNGGGSGQGDSFVMKVDGTTGYVEWVRQFSTGSHDDVLGLDTASDNSVLITLSLSLTNEFHKLSAANGTTLWSQSSLTAGIARNGVASDASGNIYITGSFNGTHNFGGSCGAQTSEYLGDNFFLAKHDAAGVCQWVQYKGGFCPALDGSICNGAYSGGAITFDNAGNVVVGGMLNGVNATGNIPDTLAITGRGTVIDFGAGPFDNYRFMDPFLVSYTPSGQWRWAKQIPAPLFGNLRGLDVSPSNKMIISGTYSGSILVDGLFMVNDSPQMLEHMNTYVGASPLPINDSAPPVIRHVDDVVIEATGPSGATGFFLPPTAIDHASGVASIYCEPRAFSTFPLGDTNVTCKATDPFGAFSQTSFTVTVVDTTGPMMRLPDPIARVAPGPTIVSFPTSAIDLVDGVRPVICIPASGSVFPLATTLVTCHADDAHGNTTTGYFNVTVSEHPAPTIVVPSMITAQATGPTGANVAFTVTATDYLDQPLTPACAPFSGSLFAFGYTNVHCIATDQHGTTSSADFLVRVIDTTPPVLTLPNVAITATNTTGQNVNYTATAIDAVDGPVTLTCVPPSGSFFPNGTTTVNCSAHDSRYNYASGSFTVAITYAWSGVLQPINADGSSIFKLGSTVPVKFELTGASAGITNLVATITYVKLTNGVPGPVNEPTSTSAADVGNEFRYTGGQYMFNLSTKVANGWVGGAGTYKLIFDFGDGVERTVIIALKP